MKLLKIIQVQIIIANNIWWLIFHFRSHLAPVCYVIVLFSFTKTYIQTAQDFCHFPCVLQRDPGKIMKSNLSGALWQLHPSPDGHNGDGKWFLVWCQLSHRPLHLLPTPSTDNNGSDDVSRSQPSAELTENNKSEYEHNFNTFVKKSDFKQKKVYFASSHPMTVKMQWCKNDSRCLERLYVY